QHNGGGKNLGLMGRIKNKFRYLDLWLLIPIIAIMIFVYAMVYTASTNMAIEFASSFLIKQAVFGLMSLIIMLVIFALKINWQSKFVIRFILGINIILLISLAYALLFGQVTSGAKGWIYIGSFGIQPVEYFKISMILYIAHRFSRKKPDKNSWFPTIKKIG